MHRKEKESTTKLKLVIRSQKNRTKEEGKKKGVQKQIHNNCKNCSKNIHINNYFKHTWVEYPSCRGRKWLSLTVDKDTGCDSSGEYSLERQMVWHRHDKNQRTKTGWMDRTTKPVYMLSIRDALQIHGHIQTESEGMEKCIPCKCK